MDKLAKLKFLLEELEDMESHYRSIPPEEPGLLMIHKTQIKINEIAREISKDA